jgi:hypothetical protein
MVIASQYRLYLAVPVPVLLATCFHMRSLIGTNTDWYIIRNEHDNLVDALITCLNDQSVALHCAVFKTCSATSKRLLQNRLNLINHSFGPQTAR